MSASRPSPKFPSVCLFLYVCDQIEIFKHRNYFPGFVIGNCPHLKRQLLFRREKEGREALDLISLRRVPSQYSLLHILTSLSNYSPSPISSVTSRCFPREVRKGRSEKKQRNVSSLNPTALVSPQISISAFNSRWREGRVAPVAPEFNPAPLIAVLTFSPAPSTTFLSSCLSTLLLDREVCFAPQTSGKERRKTKQDRHSFRFTPSSPAHLSLIFNFSASFRSSIPFSRTFHASHLGSHPTTNFSLSLTLSSPLAHLLCINGRVLSRENFR